uniref:Uncharacterized protein n=1 Tax=Panagrolaimus sp. PS1159 TaxID=55785 RepID=A0AC35GW12_9BILA
MPPSDNTPTMILPATFYDMLDPEYREKLLQLENTFKLVEKEESNIEECFDFIAEFLFQFMIPKEFWDKLFEFGCDERYRISWHVKKVFAPSVYQFYCKKYDFVDMIIYDNQKKIYESDYYLTFDVEIFLYPQKDLGKKMDDYEKYGVYSFIPKSIIQTIEKMTALYSRIKSNEKNVDKWFEALTEVEDEEFVENNIEYRIGNDLTNKELWKLYIEYLKKKDDKQNPFDFEIFDATYFEKLEEKEIQYQPTEKSPLMFHFNAENASTQRFPFKPNLMNYILKNANAYILHNLFKSCKWFYLKNPVLICYTLQPTYQKMNHLNRIQITEQSISIPDCFSLPKTLENIFITTSLALSAKRFPNILPLIYRCTVKYIALTDLILSAEELNILIGHGNVLDLYFWEIKDSSDNYLIVENLLKMVPKIKNFSIYGVQSTPESSKIICELHFENKLEWFSLTGIKNTVFEPKYFTHFIKKNIWSNGELEFEFTRSDERAASVKNFKETINAFIEENWKNEKHKPKFVVHELLE